jgi:hypothetical protein
VPVLVLPDLSKKFDMYCDASTRGLLCMLMQDDHVVSYASHPLRNLVVLKADMCSQS